MCPDLLNQCAPEASTTIEQTTRDFFAMVGSDPIVVLFCGLLVVAVAAITFLVWIGVSD